MSRIGTFIFFALALFFYFATGPASPAQAMVTKPVGAKVQGQSYNETLRRWIPRAFQMVVGIGQDGTVWLFFDGEASLGTATAETIYSTAERDKLRHAAEKTLEWAKIARDNKTDASRFFSCVGWDAEHCSDGAYKQNQMGMRFFASNEGQLQYLVLEIIDRRNRFIATTIYLEPDAVRAFLDNVNRLDETVAAAKETTGKKHLFK